jgi:hypothetical protein
MNTKQIEVLNKNRGNEHCDHRSLVKEFICGARTLDLICTECQYSISSIVRTQDR